MAQEIAYLTVPDTPHSFVHLRNLGRHFAGQKCSGQSSVVAANPTAVAQAQWILLCRSRISVNSVSSADDIEVPVDTASEKHAGKELIVKGKLIPGIEQTDRLIEDLDQALGKI